MLLPFVLASMTLVAQATPAASPSPSPTPVPHFELHATGSNTFVDQATGGPGTTPPEASVFEKGYPLSPMSPYDWFSSAPTTPGVAGVAQYVVDGTYHFSGVTADASIGLGQVEGSTTNAAYWSEPLIPNLDIHDLSRAVPYAIAFPTHAGQDDASVFRLNLLSASIGSDDGTWKLRGGYFNLTQTDRFVFAPPAITSVIPALGPATAETLGPGMPSIDAWNAPSGTLPLLGLDAVAKYGSATAEVSDALLPSLAGTSARQVMGSLVIDRGDAGRYSFDLSHIYTTGDPIETTTYFGTGQTTYDTPQGRFFTSILADQEDTIAGARAFFHPLANWDTLVELGRSWYGDSLAAEPGTSHYGNFEHVSLARHLDAHDIATIEFHRFDATYAPIILPYGVPENVWSVAWSWPGVWLKSTFQSVDNSTIGANRAGFHFRYDHTGTLEAHASYGDWTQLVPETYANASQQGFVDGFFLLQKNGFGTLGHDRQLGLYVAWHLPHDDLVFDGVEDYLNRDADPTQPADLVEMRVPQVIGSLQHHFSKTLMAVGGYGRYEAIGTWGPTPVDGIYGMGFAGVQFATGPNTALLIEGRRYALVGLPSVINGFPPTMNGTSLVVDQHISL